MRILAGDIGGTKTALAIFEIGPRGRSLVRSERYPSAAYPGLEQVVEIFLAGERSQPQAPRDSASRAPCATEPPRSRTCPGGSRRRRLARATGIRRVRVLNDFVSNALGLPVPRARQLATLTRGRAEPRGPIGIIGAGTGLGQACLVPVGDHYEVVPSESGHADFAPRNPLEDRLVVVPAPPDRPRHAREGALGAGPRLPLRVSRRPSGRARESRAVAARVRGRDDRAAVISRFGLARRDALCRDALDLFVSIYGSEAGNSRSRVPRDRRRLRGGRHRAEDPARTAGGRRSSARSATSRRWTGLLVGDSGARRPGPAPRL